MDLRNNTIIDLQLVQVSDGVSQEIQDVGVCMGEVFTSKLRKRYLIDNIVNTLNIVTCH